MMQVARATQAVNQIQAYYDEFRRHMLKKPSSSRAFYYKYRRQRLLREPEIDKLQKHHVYEKILEQQKNNNDTERMHADRSFQMDLSSRLLLKYVNPFEVDIVDSKGKPLCVPGMDPAERRARKQERRMTRLVTKTHTF